MYRALSEPTWLWSSRASKVGLGVVPYHAISLSASYGSLPPTYGDVYSPFLTCARRAAARWVASSAAPAWFFAAASLQQSSMLSRRHLASAALCTAAAKRARTASTGTSEPSLEQSNCSRGGGGGYTCFAVLDFCTGAAYANACA